MESSGLIESTIGLILSPQRSMCGRKNSNLIVFLSHVPELDVGKGYLLFWEGLEVNPRVSELEGAFDDLAGIGNKDFPRKNGPCNHSERQGGVNFLDFIASVHQLDLQGFFGQNFERDQFRLNADVFGQRIEG